MFAKSKEKARLKAQKLRRFLRDLELPFPDPNIGHHFGYGSEITESGILLKFLGGAVKKRFNYQDIDWARREIYKGGPVSWRLIRWGKCPKDTQGIRVRLNKGLFRDHLITFADLTRAEQELKYRKVAFRMPESKAGAK